LVKQKKQGKLLTLSTRVVLGAERLTQLGFTISTALVEVRPVGRKRTEVLGQTAQPKAV
jgi:hypothetical protein